MNLSSVYNPQSCTLFDLCRLNEEQIDHYFSPNGPTQEITRLAHRILFNTFRQLHDHPEKKAILSSKMSSDATLDRTIQALARILTPDTGTKYVTYSLTEACNVSPPPFFSDDLKPSLPLLQNLFYANPDHKLFKISPIHQLQDYTLQQESDPTLDIQIAYSTKEELSRLISQLPQHQHTSALVTASRCNHPEVVTRLLRDSSSLTQDSLNRAYTAAAQSNHPEILSQLLHHSLPPEQHGEERYLLRAFQTAAFNDFSDIILILLKHSTSQEEIDTAAAVAAYHSSLKALTVLKQSNRLSEKNGIDRALLYASDPDVYSLLLNPEYAPLPSQQGITNALISLASSERLLARQQRLDLLKVLLTTTINGGPSSEGIEELLQRIAPELLVPLLQTIPNMTQEYVDAALIGATVNRRIHIVDTLLTTPIQHFLPSQTSIDQALKQSPHPNFTLELLSKGLGPSQCGIGEALVTALQELTKALRDDLLQESENLTETIRTLLATHIADGPSEKHLNYALEEAAKCTLEMTNRILHAKTKTGVRPSSQGVNDALKYAENTEILQTLLDAGATQRGIDEALLYIAANRNRPDLLECLLSTQVAGGPSKQGIGAALVSATFCNRLDSDRFNNFLILLTTPIAEGPSQEDVNRALVVSETADGAATTILLRTPTVTGLRPSQEGFNNALQHISHLQSLYALLSCQEAGLGPSQQGIEHAYQNSTDPKISEVLLQYTQGATFVLGTANRVVKHVQKTTKEFVSSLIP